MAIFFSVRNILSALKPEAHAQAQAIEIRRKSKYKENQPNFPNCLDARYSGSGVFIDQNLNQNILVLVLCLSSICCSANPDVSVSACAYACVNAIFTTK